MNTKDWILEH